MLNVTYYEGKAIVQSPNRIFVFNSFLEAKELLDKCGNVTFATNDNINDEIIYLAKYGAPMISGEANGTR